MNSYNFSNFVLYSYWRSSSSWRVRIALNLKNIPYQVHPVHLLKAEHNTIEFSEKNPIQKIPVLEFTSQDNQKNYLAESLAICEFLEEISDFKLLPQDIVQRAKVRAFCSEIACNIQPIQNLPVLNRIQEIGSNKMDWAKEWITKGFESVEKLLSSSKGKYSFGDELSLADAFLIPQIYNARRFGVEMVKFPNIVEIEKNLSTLEAFIQAHPDNQPDFEGNK